MEHENYASKGQANLNTVLGTIGTVGATGFLNGGLGNILGGRNCTCSEDHYVNRYELGLQQEIAAKDARIGLLESNIYTDSKIADAYERLNAKFEARCNAIEAELCQQKVYNATCNATLNCLNGQVMELMALTSRVVPNGSICPGWGNVTVAPATTTAAA